MVNQANDLAIQSSRVNVPVALLCGGKGTRLREETEFRPKADDLDRRSPDYMAYHEILRSQIEVIKSWLMRPSRSNSEFIETRRVVI